MMRIWLKSICLPVFFLACIKATNAQEKTKIEKPVFTGASFFYDYPKSIGAAVSAEFPVLEKIKYTVSKNDHKKIKYRDLLLSLEAGFYRYPFNNTGIYFMPSLGRRYYNSNPFYFQWQGTVGFMRTFYDGLVYSVDNAGNVATKGNYGKNYAITGIAAAFGYDFERAKKPRPFAVDTKPFFWVQYPYNSFFLPHFSLTLGVKYHFNGFNILINKKEKYRKKQQ